jgi:hypothetical protein
MKLYTEEQVKEAIKLARVQKSKDFKTWFVNEEDVIMSGLTPIELPSDEEAAERLYPIKNTGSMFMPNRDEVNNIYKQEGFMEGAKWVINHIKQQDK